MKRQQHRNYHSQLWKFVAGIPRIAMWCRQTGGCSFQFQAHNWTTLYTINWCFFFFFLECFIFSRKIKRERQRAKICRCAAQQRHINSLFIPSKSSVRLAMLSYTDTFTQYSSNYIYYLVARDTQHLNETRNMRAGNQVLSLCSSLFFFSSNVRCLLCMRCEWVWILFIPVIGDIPLCCCSCIWFGTPITKFLLKTHNKMSKYI